jgi:type IV secretion system protein VirB4
MLENGLTNKLERLMARQERDPKTYRMAWFDDHLAFLHECITGIAQRIRLPVVALPNGVDYILGSYSFLTGIRPQLNGKLIRVIAIETPPDVGTSFGMLEILNLLGVQFRWTTRWIARDPEKVKASVSVVASKWRQKIRGLAAEMFNKPTKNVNRDAQDMADDAQVVLKDIDSGEVSYGFWTSTVILMDDDSKFMDATVAYLLKMIRNEGFSCRDEEVNCTEAFLGSIPGHGYENLRRPEIHSMNLADCLPLTSTWQGPTENKCEFYKKFYDKQPVPPLFHGSASGGTPFRVVLHNGDIGHTGVFGPTGAGKSTLLGLIEASQFRYPDARVYAFDKGGSMLALCLASGGNHYDFFDEKSDNSNSIGFAPFAHIDRLADKIWAADYVETILLLHEIKVDIDTRSEINNAIELLATRPATMRSFTDLATLVQTREIRQVLGLYENQLAGGMLNGRSDTITTNRFTVFEMEHLMEMGEKHVVPVLLYLFRMIERSLDGSPTLILLDEAWLMLTHPLFEEKIKEWLKVLRKANAAVIFSTQELQDVANSPIASTIFSACQTKILLPNAEAQSEENVKLYKMIGLTEREIELLKYATPKRDYFFTSPAGRRLFQLELGPIALAFIGASGIDDRNIIKGLHKTYKEDWVKHWLKHRNINPSILQTQKAAAYA